MSPNLIVSGMMILMLGPLGMFDAAAADTRRDGYPTGLSKNESEATKTVIVRTVGWSRYYSRPIYRCRRFSSECYYFRPAHYVRHWSYSYRTNSGNQPSGDTGPVEGKATRREAHTPKPARYYINSKTLKPEIVTKAQNTGDKTHRGQIVAAYWVSGGFVRIASPGHSSRWIRADAPSMNRQGIKSMTGISTKSQKP